MYLREVIGYSFLVVEICVIGHRAIYLKDKREAFPLGSWGVIDAEWFLAKP